MRLLVVEDNEDLASALCRGLREEGFIVDHAAGGADGLLLAQSEDYDLILLDISLPEVSGFQILETLRSEHNDVPVVFLTARKDVEDRVRGLRLGGDDYLAKPFSFEELLARIRAVLRRSSGFPQGRLLWGRLEMKPEAHLALWDNQPVDLTHKEFQLLETFLLNKGKVLTRTRLALNVYDNAFECDSNVIDAHVSNLRKKLLKATGAALIETVRGVGFRLPESPS